MTNDQIADYLDAAATAEEGVAKILPQFAVPELVIAGLLKLGAMLARKGLDPVIHVTRLVDLDGAFDGAAKDADTAADQKFRGQP